MRVPLQDLDKRLTFPRRVHELSFTHPWHALVKPWVMILITMKMTTLPMMMAKMMSIVMAIMMTMILTMMMSMTMMKKKFQVLIIQVITQVSQSEVMSKSCSNTFKDINHKR